MENANMAAKTKTTANNTTKKPTVPSLVLDAALVTELAKYATTAKAAIKAMNNNAIKAGEALWNAKALLQAEKKPATMFYTWAEAKVGVKKAMACRLINAYEFTMSNPELDNLTMRAMEVALNLSKTDLGKELISELKIIARKAKTQGKKVNDSQVKALVGEETTPVAPVETTPVAPTSTSTNPTPKADNKAVELAKKLTAATKNMQAAKKAEEAALTELEAAKAKIAELEAILSARDDTIASLMETIRFMEEQTKAAEVTDEVYSVDTEEETEEFVNTNTIEDFVEAMLVKYDDGEESTIGCITYAVGACMFETQGTGLKRKVIIGDKTYTTAALNKLFQAKLNPKK